MSGQVYSWGEGLAGRLGQGFGPTDRGIGLESTDTPTQIVSMESYDIIALNAGYSHSLAITEHGDILAWGCAASGKLGLGEVPDDIECYAAIPTKVRFPRSMSSSRVSIVQVACGA